MLVASAVTASACSHADPKPVVRIVQRSAVLPAAARQPCERPRILPDRDMTSQEVTSNWGADRAALMTCETKRAAAVSAVDASETRP